MKSNVIKNVFAGPRFQQITRPKAYRQSVSLYCATNIIKPTCVGIYQKNYFLLRDAPKKIQNHPRRLLCLDQTIMATISQSIWWDSSFNMERRPMPAMPMHDFGYDGISLYSISFWLFLSVHINSLLQQRRDQIFVELFCILTTNFFKGAFEPLRRIVYLHGSGVCYVIGKISL